VESRYKVDITVIHWTDLNLPHSMLS